MSLLRSIIFLVPFCLATPVRAQTSPLVKTAADAQSVSPEDVSGPVPFDLTGTALGASHRTFLFRDETGGLVLENELTNDVSWSVGDFVRVCGDMTVNPDERRFARVRRLEVLAHCEPPAPCTASGDEILDGRRNFQFVTVEGVVQSLLTDDLDPKFIWLALRTPSGIVMCATSDSASLRQLRTELIDAEVSITGLVSPAVGWRHGFQPFVSFRRSDAIRLLLPRPNDPFVSRPTRNGTVLHRRCFSGRVLARTESLCCLLSTANRFIEAVANDETTPPPAGSVVSVAGFSEANGSNLKLTECLFKMESASADQQEAPRPVTFDQLYRRANLRQGINTDLHGSLVTISGHVSRAVPDRFSERSFALTDGNRIISIDCSGLNLPLPDEASVLQATGILLAEFEPITSSVSFPVFRAFRLIPRTPEDLFIIRHPPWWTPLRLLTVLLIVLCMLVAVLIWNRSLKVLALRRGEELAREQLAHKAAALKVEERTRLAVEIHDAISQTLTGIALLFDSASDEAATPSLQRFFAVARQMLASCRKELKGCLWDLRSRTFEEKDLTEALRRTLQPYSAEVTLPIRFNVPHNLLTESVTHDILRIVRELVANAIRHGHARHIRIAGVRNGTMIRFSVQDDGIGFDPKTAPGPRDGHFGLQGIRERIKPRQGQLELTVRRPHGTRVRITLEMGEFRHGND